jgi:hypothetical protein
MWLAGMIPEDLKPEFTHVLLTDLRMDLKVQGIELEKEREVVIVTLSPEYPTAHREGKMKDFLNQLLKNGVELIVVSKGEKLYMRWGTV